MNVRYFRKSLGAYIYGERGCDVTTVGKGLRIYACKKEVGTLCLWKRSLYVTSVGKGLRLYACENRLKPYVCVNVTYVKMTLGRYVFEKDIGKIRLWE